MTLGNGGGAITRLDLGGLKVHGVAYTADQSRDEGWTVTFGRPQRNGVPIMANYEPPALVPVVRGLSVRDATAALAHAGLEPIAADDPDMRVEGTFPAAGAVTTKGAKVNLLSSLLEIDGIEKDTFGLVPETAGLDANTVVDMLRGRGFLIAQFQTHPDSDIAEGLVTGTWPGAGTYTGTSGAWITVYISGGPPPVEVTPPPPPPDQVLKA